MCWVYSLGVARRPGARPGKRPAVREGASGRARVRGAHASTGPATRTAPLSRRGGARRRLLRRPVGRDEARVRLVPAAVVAAASQGREEGSRLVRRLGPRRMGRRREGDRDRDRDRERERERERERRRRRAEAADEVPGEEGRARRGVREDRIELFSVLELCCFRGSGVRGGFFLVFFRRRRRRGRRRGRKGRRRGLGPSCRQLPPGLELVDALRGDRCGLFASPRFPKEGGSREEGGGGGG